MNSNLSTARRRKSRRRRKANRLGGGLNKEGKQM
jgi:hypothetical protein